MAHSKAGLLEVEAVIRSAKFKNNASPNIFNGSGERVETKT